MQKVISICLCVLISMTSVYGLNTNLEGLETNCCCKSKCECEHKKFNNRIIRNIKCGDNLPGIEQTTKTHYLIGQVIIKDYKIKKVEKNNDLLFELIKKQKNSIDPPPPKTFS